MKRIYNLYFYGNRNERQIALAFDDGPSEETKKILDILKKNKVKATFFIWGQRIKERGEIIKRINDEGHEIGNHSFYHKRLWFKSKGFIEKDILKCDGELKELRIKTNLFRPPGLKIGINLLRVCKKLNKKIIACDVLLYDWKKQKTNKLINKILNKTKNGSIISLHDYLEGIGRNEEVIEVINNIIPKLKEKGFKLQTVSEILNFNELR